MASKTITQLTALDTISTNLANTLFVVYDSETGSTKKASLSQIDSAVERSIQNVTSAGVYANGAFVTANSASSYSNGAFVSANSASSYANGAFVSANSASSYANGAFASANTKLSLTGGTITGNLIANNLTVSNTFSVQGVSIIWHSPVPLTSKGDPGDEAGYIAVDNDKLYRCVENYTDGANNIWRFVNFTGGTWG
jgi:hypothetical protein